MIEVTRLNGQKIVINALLIESIDQTPDTHVALTSGKKLIIYETPDEVVERIRTYLKSIGVFSIPLTGVGDNTNEK